MDGDEIKVRSEKNINDLNTLGVSIALKIAKGLHQPIEEDLEELLKETLDAGDAICPGRNYSVWRESEDTLRVYAHYFHEKEQRRNLIKNSVEQVLYDLYEGL